MMAALNVTVKTFARVYDIAFWWKACLAGVEFCNYLSYLHFNYSNLIVDFHSGFLIYSWPIVWSCYKVIIERKPWARGEISETTEEDKSSDENPE